jgi:hypothetical protein
LRINDYRPIAYMASSQETTVDFEFFYRELKTLLANLKIHDSIGTSWIMGDACQAHFNGLTSVYPTCKPLMCYFHMRDILK